MIKWTIKYENFDGEEKERVEYFHFTEAELYEMELSAHGGLHAQLESLVETQDLPAVIVLFKEIILRAYGKRSPDGELFEKSDEIRANFENSAAYGALFMELSTDAEKGANFINGIVPASLREKMEEQDKPVGPPPLPAPKPS